MAGEEGDGTPVQQTNCHPFRFDNWLWMHNGAISKFEKLKREFAFAVDPALHPFIEGSTDSEMLFFLALTFGLETDPPRAVERAVGLVEATGRRHGIEHPIQMTVATSLRTMHPDNALLQEVGEESRLVVSEPLGDLAGAWNEVPEASWGVIRPGADDLQPFTPSTPSLT